ncbi:Snf7-domain-containing protein [Chytriomyces cf. hyalinus JEL632]|nr:Snf7-domain-containing protein [Chytriomyces cf. hyalinus JEL632]
MSLEAFLQRQSEWSSDQRMNSLFARFPEKGVNKTLYESRLRFWTSLINSAARERLLTANSQNENAFILQTEALPALFTRKGLTPRGLDTVVIEMRASNDLVPVSKYLDDVISGGWSIFSLVTAPLRFGLSFVSGPSAEPEEFAGKDVLVSLVQVITQSAIRLFNYVKDEAAYSTDYIHDASIFQKATQRTNSEKQLTALDQRILARYLETSGKAVIEYGTANEPLAIKFLSSPSSNAVITGTDRGILNIKNTAQSLQLQISNLEAKVAELKSNASSALKNNARSRALIFLKQKTSVSSVLEKRIASLHTLETILSKIQQAETDAEIVHAYKLGTVTLQSVLKTHNLTPDSVQQTLDSLSDAFADQNEIDAVLAAHHAENALDVDDEEIERELEDLVKAGTAAEPGVKAEAKTSQDADVDALVDVLGSLRVESGEVSKIETKESERNGKQLVPAE